MIARKTVQNLKGGNETRGQVRRRLKFRPIFCPFFRFSLSPLCDYRPPSLTHSVRFPLFSPSAHARAYIFANFSLPLYREPQSHPIVHPIFHPLPLFSINRKSLVSHRPRLVNVRPRMRTPRTLPSALLLIHLSHLALHSLLALSSG